MSALSFLSRLGMEALKVGQVVVGLEPLALQISQIGGGMSGVPKAANELVQVGELVKQVEVIGAVFASTGGTMTGAQKAKAITPAIAQIVMRSDLIAGKKIADPAKFQAACERMGGDIADILNALEGDVKTEDKT